MSIHLGYFDDRKVQHNFPISDIQERITLTAPKGARVTWSFPGYISILLSDGVEIAFGESLESASGYSWNNYDVDGTNTYCNSFDDLASIDAIVSELWNQVSHLTNKEAK